VPAARIAPLLVLAGQLSLSACAEPAPPVRSATVARAPTRPVTPRPPVGVEAAAIEIVDRIDRGDADGLFARFDPRLRAAVPRERLGVLIAGITAQVGALGAPAAQQVGERDGRFLVRGARGALVMHLVVADDGAIAGLRFVPAEDRAAPPVDRTVPLGPPFRRGTWRVAWGGDTRALNHHIDHASQRRALDLVVADEAGTTHRAAGRRNEDYAAYGEDVVAVADGRVAQVVDGVPDNVPGETNTLFVPGNLIVLEHAPDRFSVYAHLIPGSPKVRVGQRVRRGQLLGRCGNSGNSSEPHLHFQVQDAPRFEHSWGVEPIFDDAVTIVRAGGPLPGGPHALRRDDRVTVRSRLDR
jgi:murein DD-endopeptidase MepM/ murein hydrolase activator NlpD